MRRQLGRRLDIVQIDAAPTDHLGTVAQVQIFAERVSLPTSDCFVFDATAPPDACRAIEAKWQAGIRAGGLFDDKMSVQGQRLGLGQGGVSRVQMRPAGLDESNIASCFCQKGRNGAEQKVWQWGEICVKDSNELAACGGGAGLQRPRLKTLSIVPMQNLNIDAFSAPEGGPALRNSGGAICGIVKDLDLQTIGGIVQLRAGIDQTADHVQFIVNWKLNGHSGPMCRVALRFYLG